MRRHVSSLLGVLALLSGCPGGAAEDLPPAAVQSPSPVPLKAEFRILAADERAPELERLALAVEASEDAAASGIVVNREVREMPDGESVVVRVIEAKDRAGLASGLGRILAAQPELAPPPGHEMLFGERVQLTSRGTEQLWRVYWADARRQIKPTVLLSVGQTDDPAGMPAVRLTLVPDDAEALAVLTRDNVGQPLLFLSDDRVLSAPIVREPITHGKVLLLPGSSSMSVEEQRTEATSLVRALLGE